MRELLYEGKGKKLFKSDEKGALIALFKDELTAFDATKKGFEQGKGELNCAISTQLFELLQKEGVKTHLIKKLSKNEQLIQECKIIKIEVIIRNVATGSLTKRLGIKDGTVLPFALCEFCYKDDSLHDPFINDEHCLLLGLVDSAELLEEIRQKARKINTILKDFFIKKELRLIDFKLEFGLNDKGELLLADEISPDSCRFWDAKSGEKLDKDRFRQDLGEVSVAYAEVLQRMQE